MVETKLLVVALVFVLAFAVLSGCTASTQLGAGNESEEVPIFAGDDVPEVNETVNQEIEGMVGELE
ncbi:MAG: hypothetical protein ABIH99_00680 [Candidatus Micrarchaeota archaeon]